jgi:DNA-binding response OmpR family regulator
VARVLIVNDEPEFAALLHAFIVTKGHEPLVARTGQEALSTVKEGRPLIVLLDIHTPGMDGIDLLRQIRDIDREVGVVMLTAADEVEIARQALRLGAFDFLVKPLDLTRVEQVLGYTRATTTV